jgi:thiamine pyrophosphate-dependent acetolactate synthase large subunit-like protein
MIVFRNIIPAAAAAAAAMALWSDIIGVVVAFAGPGYFALLR